LKIYISHVCVATQLSCGGIINNDVVANCSHSVRVNIFLKSAMFGKDVDKGSVARFLWLTVYYINQFLNVLYVSLYHCNNKLHTVPCTEKPRNYSRL